MTDDWKNKSSKKGQGALEYLLLIGGAVLIATIVLLIIISSTGSTNDIINNNLGVYQSHVTLGATGGSGPAAVCGNNNVESGEACDDGDVTSGDGCSSTCTVESGWSCSGDPSVCVPSVGTQASSFSVNYTTMDSVIFAGVAANNTQTRNVTFNNSSGSALTITGFTPTFSAGGALTDISFGGISVWSGSAATGVPVSGLTIPVAPGSTPNVTFTFSAATHTVAGNNSFRIVFDFSDASQCSNTNCPLLQDWSITPGTQNGVCTGSLFENTPAITVGAMVTDRGLTTFEDRGIVGDWSITPPVGASAVAFATLRMRVASVAINVTGPPGNEYIVNGTTNCVTAGLNDNTDNAGPPGVAISIAPDDDLTGFHFFDVEPFVPSGAGSFQYVMTGQDVGLSNSDFRSYNTAMSTNPPTLTIGYVV